MHSFTMVYISLQLFTKFEITLRAIGQGYTHSDWDWHRTLSVNDKIRQLTMTTRLIHLYLFLILS